MGGRRARSTPGCMAGDPGGMGMGGGGIRTAAAALLSTLVW